MTDDLKARLRSNTPNMTAGHAIMWQAADRIEQLEAENFALASWQCVFTDGRTGIVCDENGNQFCQQALALTQSRAETAAAYERAAVIADNYVAMRTNQIEVEKSKAARHMDVAQLIRWRAGKVQSEAIRDAIRALATADQTAALDAVREEARAQGMREAAILIVKHEMGTPMHSPPQLLTEAHDRILAAIKGAKA